MQIKTALLSVSNKENIIELATFLNENEIEIISTGGTAKKLKKAGIPITPIEEVTKNPEAFGGRMKTISFQIGSGILFRRDNSDDLKEVQDLNIKPIDLVVCNLYPFEDVAKTTKDLISLIENIDIGGPTMIRAAAKNYKNVVTLSSPNQYKEFIQNYSQDKIDINSRFSLAMKAIALTAHYDQFIVRTLGEHSENTTLPLQLENTNEIRYGENPHQRAWFSPWQNHYADYSLESLKQLQGKDLSYNNYIDMDAAWKTTSELVEFFPNEKTVTIVKHANPCGVATGANLLNSLKKAWECDSTSAFGSIISFSHEVGEEEAKWLIDRFVEVLIAPSFSDKALEIFGTKKNLRLMEGPLKPKNSKEIVINSINGGILFQEEDEKQNYEFKQITDTSFPATKTELMNFGMVVNKFLKSNSIALVGMKEKYFVLAGTGMGQPNRIDSLKMLAAPRAKELGHNLADLVLISDAFFPFRDSIDEAAELGIKYILQPGGSIRDSEVIEACNENKIAMAFTGTRHFRH